MWVYPSDEVRTSPEPTALLPQLPAESGTPKQSVPEPLNAGEAMPDGVAQQPERLHRRMRHACWRRPFSSAQRQRAACRRSVMPRSRRC